MAKKPTNQQFLIINSRNKPSKAKKVTLSAPKILKKTQSSVGNEPLAVNPAFLGLLHDNAVKIQQWYRKICLQRQVARKQIAYLLQTHRKSRPPIRRPSDPRKKLAPKANLQQADSTHTSVANRRAERANAARNELVIEFQQKRSMNSSCDTLYDKSTAMSDGKHSQSFARESKVNFIEQLLPVHKLCLKPTIVDAKTNESVSTESSNHLNSELKLESILEIKPEKSEEKEYNLDLIKVYQREEELPSSETRDISIIIMPKKLDEENESCAEPRVNLTVLCPTKSNTAPMTSLDTELLSTGSCPELCKDNNNTLDSPSEILEDQYPDKNGSDSNLEMTIDSRESRSYNRENFSDVRPMTRNSVQQHQRKSFELAHNRDQVKSASSITFFKDIIPIEPVRSAVNAERPRVLIDPVSLEPMRNMVTVDVTTPKSLKGQMKFNNPTIDERANESVQRILGFLQNVETAESQEPIQKLERSITDAYQHVESLPFPSTKTAFDTAKQRILGQQLELDEATKSVQLYKSEIKKLKEETMQQGLELKKETKTRINLQRREYESIIKRHLSFIDKLIAEKDDLAQKCDGLRADVKGMDKAFQEKFCSVEEAHFRDNKQQKELWHASEKVKRDKWIGEKTKAIKDQTVRGLEPEIQRMLSQHKVAQRQLDEKMREEFHKERESIMDSNQRQLSNMRDRIVGERQKACEEEREFARQRYQKQLERDELEFQQQKRKLQADFNEQTHNTQESHKRVIQEMEKLSEKQIGTLRSEIQCSRQSHESQVGEMQKTHLNALNEQHDEMNVRHHAWQADYSKTNAQKNSILQAQWKEKLIIERDAEIEMIVHRLAMEGSNSDSDASHRHRMEIERIKGESAEDVKKIQVELGCSLDRVVDLQTRAGEFDIRCKTLVRQVAELEGVRDARDYTILQQKNALTRLEVDEIQLAATIRSEFSDSIEQRGTEILKLSQQISALEMEITSVNRLHADETGRASRESQEMLNTLESQVKKSLGARDDQIAQLKQRISDLDVKNTHFARMIESQREEICALVQA